MPARRARSGRGWDAAPPRTRRRHRPDAAARDGVESSGAPGAGPPGSGSPGAGSPGAGSPGAGRAGRDPSSRPPEPPPDPHEIAREICLRQLSVRPRTRAELATALRKRGVDDEVAASVLDRYDEVGLIDDAAFARAWVTSRHHGRGLARRALANELRQRGVDAELVDEALEDLDGETEAETARSLVERRLRSMPPAAPDAVFRRLVAMLARKGYPAGVAIGAVKEALAGRDAEVDALDVDQLAYEQEDPDASAFGPD